MQTVLITGGTGLIGKRLTDMLLQKNYTVIVLTRDPDKYKKSGPNLSYSAWDVKEKRIDKQAVSRSDYIVHLAGASVGEKRWTSARKKEILESRTLSSALLAETLNSVNHKVKAVISASGVGYYGNDKTLNKVFAEQDKAGNDFLAHVCKEWENAIAAVANSVERLVILRTGIVISKKGGMLQPYTLPLKLRVAPVLGSGEQRLSPVHIDDMCRMYIHAMENNISGIFNAASPDVVTNKDLAVQLVKILKGNPVFPIKVPAFLLRIFLGEFSTEALKSTPVDVQKISDTGFEFLYPDLRKQLKAEK